MKRLTPAHLLRTVFAAILREKVALSACCFILVLPAPGLLAQGPPVFCDELIQRAERALKARDYISASAFVEAALPICPARNDTLRTLTKRINEAINAEKKAAEEGADASHNIARALDLDRSNPSLALRLYEYNYYAHVGNIGATLPFIDAVASRPSFSPSALKGHSDLFISVSWSPDGKLLAGASADSIVSVWNWEEKRTIDSLNHAGPVGWVAWSPAGKQIACALKNGGVMIWDRENKEQYSLSGHAGEVYSVAWSPKGEYIASASADRTIKIWNPKEKKLLHTLTGHQDAVNSISWSPDGKLLASASSDRTLKIWDCISWHELQDSTLKHNAKVSSVAWFPDTAYAYVASASSDGIVKIWDWARRGIVDSLTGHLDRVQIAWRPDKKQIASASTDGSVKIWDWDTKEILYDLKGDFLTRSGLPARYFSVAWSPNGQQLAAAINDMSIKIWDWATKQAQVVHTGHTGAVNAVAWSPDGMQLAGASADSTVRVWEFGKREAKPALKGHSGPVNTVAWSADGQLASASDDGKVIIWNLDEQDRSNTLTTGSSVKAVAWSPSGRHLAAALENGYIVVWDAATLKLQHQLAGHWDWANTLAWSPDGKLLASASGDGAVKIWNWAEGKELHSLSGGRWAVIRSVSWSPCGRWIVSASSDGTLRIWDWAAQRLLSTIEEPFDGFWSVAWSPGGGQVAGTSHDNTVKVWDVAAKQALFSLAGHSGRINAVAWSPKGGEYIAAASSDSTIMVWAARPYLADKIPVYSPADLLRNGARLHQLDLDTLKVAADLALAAGQFKEAGRDERALAFFKKAFAQKDNLDWLFDICTLSESLGVPFEHSHFDAYTEVDAYQKLAIFYEQRGEKIRALSFYEKAYGQQRRLDWLWIIFTLSEELGKPFEYARFDSFEEVVDNVEIARLFERRGDKIKSMKYYEKAFEKSTRLEWLFIIFRLSEELGQNFNHERFDAFESEEELYDISRFYEQKRDIPRALSFYQKTWAKRASTDIAKKISILSDQLGLHFNPEDLPHEDAAACAALAGYFEGEGDWGKARAYAQKAYDKSPNDMHKAKLIEMTMLSGELSALTRETGLKVLTTVARSLNQKGKWPEAERVYQKLFDLDEGNPAHRQLLFYVQFRQGSDTFDKLFSKESIENIEVHFNWFIRQANPSNMGGDTLALISWYEKATILGEQLLKHSPGDTVLARRLSQNYNGIGWQGLFQGLYVEAEEALRQGIKVDPGNPYLYTNLPIALLLQGRYDESFKMFDEYKDKKYAPERNLPTYRDIFILDFDRLEEAVAIPPERQEDVERIRRYLRDGVRE